jgi:hypothetical protein
MISISDLAQNCLFCSRYRQKQKLFFPFFLLSLIVGADSMIFLDSVAD